MKLYLSSYQIGNSGAELERLVKGNRRIGVIRNALDYSEDQERLSKGREWVFKALHELRLVPEELDLRAYFHKQADLKTKLLTLDAVWVVGGNTFILRRAMRQSGFDTLLQKRSADNGFVYGGYSAGVCVLTPTLKGIHLVDDPDIVPFGYDREIIWDGLNIVPFCIAPHYKSNHQESSLIDKSVDYFINNKLPFVALRDGEALIRDTQTAWGYNTHEPLV